MSKADHNANYYYIYTSPASNAPAAELGASSSSSTPPPYDGAVVAMPVPSAPVFNPPQEQQNHLVLDTSFSPYNPAVVPDHDESNMPLLVSGISDDDEFRGRPPPPNYSIYEPLYETACDGEIITRDPHLNSDGEAIVQFFVQHNTPPRLEVQFHGHHEETRWETRSTRDQDGNLVEERVPMNVIVDDFNFSIDASDFVAPECDGLCVSPDKKTGIRKSVRQLCDDFVHDKNKLKELELTKVVHWNYHALSHAFTAAIRASGYHDSVHISYKLKEHKITIKSTSKWSRYLEHKGIRLLLFLSCLWILVLPIQWFYRKRFGHNSLWSNWHMKITAQDWYNLQVQEVTHHVHHRCSRVGTVPFISG